MKNNILLIVIDCLREDMVREETMPFLHSLKKKGIYFTNVYAQSSWTKTSMASVMTGTFPFVHNVHTIANKLPDELPTLAECMVEKGYDTFYATANHYSTIGTSLERGFNSRFIENITDERLIGGFFALQKIHQKPWFGYLHLMNLHRYYCDYGNYMETCPKVDSNIKYLFNEINTDNTMIIITADHGYGFGEHGIYTHNPGLYNELIKVPLLIMFPSKFHVPPRKYKVYLNLKMLYNFIKNGEYNVMNNEIIYSERWNTSRFTRIQTIIMDDWKLIYYSPLNKWKIIKSLLSIKDFTIFKNMFEAGKNYFMRRKIINLHILELYNLREDPNETHPLLPMLDCKNNYYNELLLATLRNLIESSKQYQPKGRDK